MRRVAFVILVVGLGCSTDAGAPRGATSTVAGAAAGVHRATSKTRSGAAERGFARAGSSWVAIRANAGLRATVEPRGVVVSPGRQTGDSGTVTVSTTAIGRVGAMRSLDDARAGACQSSAVPASTTGCLGPLAIDRGAGVVETWRNLTAGLEQGFEIARRPPGRGPLSIEVRFDGPIEGRLGGDGIVLRRNGRDVLRYAGLSAWDASGTVLPSRLAWRAGTASLLIDDASARYPIVVDPLLDTPAWTAEVDQADARFGAAVASAGDVNGDGYDDVIVGAPGFDNGELDEGRAFLFLGSVDGLEAEASWTAESNQAPNAGILVSFGATLAAAGDVNRDGYDDVIVGAFNYTNGEDGEGRAYLYLGSANGLEANEAWTSEGNHEWAEYAYSVDTAGDVNGDGYDDVIVGARNVDTAESYAGRALVFLGQDGGLEAVASWTAEANVNSAHFGRAVAGGGDVNGDTFDDVVVARENDPGTIYLFRGSADGLEAVAGWSAQPGGNCESVAIVGDVNGDGYDDVLCGCWDGAFLYYGSVDGLEDDPAWSARADDGSIAFGWSVSGAGDVDGDGYADVLVGQYDYSNPESNEGGAFLYYGSADGLPADPGWTAEADQDSAELGWSVAEAGDVDGDGYDDVIVGAPFYSNGEVSEGRATLFHGQVDDGVACPDGVWHSGECDATHCYLDSQWFLNGDVNPADPCQVCTVAVSQVDWSPGADLVECAAGLCRAGACEAVCSIGGTWVDDGDENPDEECQTCAVARNTRAWSSAADGTPCTDGLCNDGHCDAAECYIRSAWTVNAGHNPDNECQLCDIATSRTEWTNADEGASCTDGLCREGACLDDRCYVEGAWYVDGADNPANSCQMCDVASSRTRWSPNSSGDCGSADGGPDGGGDDDDGGCSCRAAGSGGTTPWWWIGACLAGLVAKRRRRLTARCAPRSPRPAPASATTGSR